MNSIFRGEEEMLAVLDTLALSDDPMFVIDDRNRIVFWNRAIEQFLGYSHDEMAGRSCAVLGGDDHFGNRYCANPCPVQQFARRGDPIRQFRLQFRAKEGRLVPLDVTVMRFTLRSSRRILLAHIVRTPADHHAATPEPPHAMVTRDHTDARVRELTTREIEILGLLAGGQSVRGVADSLTISPLTARNHIQHIFEKLEVHSQSQAVAFAYRTHIIPSP